MSKTKIGNIWPFWIVVPILAIALLVGICLIVWSLVSPSPTDTVNRLYEESLHHGSTEAIDTSRAQRDAGTTVADGGQMKDAGTTTTTDTGSTETVDGGKPTTSETIWSQVIMVRSTNEQDASAKLRRPLEVFAMYGLTDARPMRPLIGHPDVFPLDDFWGAEGSNDDAIWFKGDKPRYVTKKCSPSTGYQVLDTQYYVWCGQLDVYVHPNEESTNNSGAWCGVNHETGVNFCGGRKFYLFPAK